MITIRAMKEADDRIASEINAACYRFTAGPDGLADEQVDWAIREYCTPECMSMQRCKYTAMIAEIGPTVVGVVITGDSKIYGLFVHPSYHRQGVGKALFFSAQSIVERSGHSVLELTTSAAAERFYEIMGMRRVGTRFREHGVFSGKELILMEKRLAPHQPA